MLIQDSEGRDRDRVELRAIAAKLLKPSSLHSPQTLNFRSLTKTTDEIQE
ncbi:MAG: hypothetical protein IGS48_01470 [Oscillatoriales cyanobacterium C42_A2020_001]|nr:hypothetical protein [Leptolyngbyaceae cyanobacterium C42_A2020_001]